MVGAASRRLNGRPSSARALKSIQPRDA